jgi:transcriptional regulator with XRE-family HTH domain
MPKGMPWWHNKTPKTLPELIGATIQLRRHKIGISQRELAKILGVCLSTVQMFEKATSWHLTLLEEMATALHMNPFDLLDEARRLGDHHNVVFTLPQHPATPPRLKKYDVDALLGLCNTLVAVQKMLGRINRHARGRIEQYQSVATLAEFQKRRGRPVSPDRKPPRQRKRPVAEDNPA